MSKEIFYVAFPTYQYNEDVKALATQKGLTIIDSAYQGNNKQCKNAPELTIKGSKPKTTKKSYKKTEK